MKKLILSSFAFATLVFISNSASAQLVQQSTLGVNISPVIELTKTKIDDLGTPLAFANAADLTGGVETAIDAVILNYKANVRTHVLISATNFTSATSSTIMPATVIKFNTDGSSTYTKTMSTGDQVLSGSTGLASGGFGNSAGSADIKIRYKVTPGLMYDPATDYSTIITYTITAN